MKKNIFLNKKYLVKWTINGSAFLVQSPFNPQAGIWWSKAWYQPSKYPDYFATGIDFNQEYQEIIYGEQGIESINIISGQKLFAQFNYLKTSNSIKYLQMTMQTKNHLNHLIKNQQPIFQEQFVKVKEQKLEFLI